MTATMQRPAERWSFNSVQTPTKVYLCGPGQKNFFSGDATKDYDFILPKDAPVRRSGGLVVTGFRGGQLIGGNETRYDRNYLQDYVDANPTKFPKGSKALGAGKVKKPDGSIITTNDNNLKYDHAHRWLYFENMKRLYVENQLLTGFAYEGINLGGQYPEQKDKPIVEFYGCEIRDALLWMDTGVSGAGASHDGGDETQLWAGMIARFYECIFNGGTFQGFWTMLGSTVGLIQLELNRVWLKNHRGYSAFRFDDKVEATFRDVYLTVNPEAPYGSADPTKYLYQAGDRLTPTKAPDARSARWAVGTPIVGDVQFREPDLSTWRWGDPVNKRLKVGLGT